MIVKAVPTAFVHQTWPKVEQWLRFAGTFSNEYTLDDLKLMVIQNQKQLVIAEDGERIIGAAVVTYINRPKHRVGFITTIGGRGIITEEGVAQLKELLKKNGATYLEGAGRESIVRLYRKHGLAPKYTVFGAEI